MTNEDRPLLATPEQAEAERMVLQLLDDPEIAAMQRELTAELAALPTARNPDAAARFREAVAQWTTSFVFAEVTSYQPSPAFIWATDNTPRSWFGHDLPGAGIAGDNPDFIYRRLTVDGAGRYEISGRINLDHRPAELTFEVMRGNVGPMALKDQSRKHADMGNQVAVIDDRSISLGEDGSFQITLGGPPTGGDHLAMEPGEMTILMRDVLSDWNQIPAWIRIERVEGTQPPARDFASLKQAVLAKLGDYVRFWGNYHTTWLGGLEPNSFAGPVARDGGWGYICGARFQLGDDEALLITTTDGGAGYRGFQITDPWMITSNALRHQTSLNPGAVVPDADGRFTYLVAPTDPGVANWLDTAGLRSGFALLRWQAVPASTAGDKLVQDFRVISLAEAAALPGVARVTPEERSERRAALAAAYAGRAAK